MDEDRSAVITIGGEEYELLLSTRATKEIGRRYGGLETLGEKLMKSENFELALDELVWLITLLANAAIQRHNVKNPTDVKPLLTDDEVEILTSPFEIAGYRNAITEAMFKGTARNILSEEDAAADPNAETG